MKASKIAPMLPCHAEGNDRNIHFRLRV